MQEAPDILLNIEMKGPVTPDIAHKYDFDLVCDLVKALIADYGF